MTTYIAHCVLALSLLRTVAFAQATYRFDKAALTGFPGWNCLAEGQRSSVAVEPPLGVVKLYGNDKRFWDGNHQHCIWVKGGQATSALLTFTFAAALEPSFLDTWTDQKLDLTRDCFAHNLEYSLRITNGLQCVTVRDSGGKWIAACAGDFWLTLGEAFEPSNQHAHYLEVGMLQRLSDGTIKILSRQTIAGEFSTGQPLSRLEVSVDGTIGWYSYQDRAGNAYSSSAPLVEVPSKGKAGVITVVIPRHLCMLRPAARRVDFFGLEIR